jgi:hypothetical protein
MGSQRFKYSFGHLPAVILTKLPQGSINNRVQYELVVDPGKDGKSLQVGVRDFMKPKVVLENLGYLINERDIFGKEESLPGYLLFRAASLASGISRKVDKFSSTYMSTSERYKVSLDLERIRDEESAIESIKFVFESIKFVFSNWSLYGNFFDLKSSIVIKYDANVRETLGKYKGISEIGYFIEVDESSLRNAARKLLALVKKGFSDTKRIALEGTLSGLLARLEIINTLYGKEIIYIDILDVGIPAMFHVATKESVLIAMVSDSLAKEWRVEYEYPRREGWWSLKRIDRMKSHSFDRLVDYFQDTKLGAEVKVFAEFLGRSELGRIAALATLAQSQICLEGKEVSLAEEVPSHLRSKGIGEVAGEMVKLHIINGYKSISGSSKGKGLKDSWMAALARFMEQTPLYLHGFDSEASFEKRQENPKTSVVTVKFYFHNTPEDFDYEQDLDKTTLFGPKFVLSFGPDKQMVAEKVVEVKAAFKNV